MNDQERIAIKNEKGLLLHYFLRHVVLVKVSFRKLVLARFLCGSNDRQISNPNMLKLLKNGLGGSEKSCTLSYFYKRLGEFSQIKMLICVIPPAGTFFGLDTAPPKNEQKSLKSKCLTRTIKKQVILNELITYYISYKGI